MIEHTKWATVARRRLRLGVIAMISSLALGGAAAGQDSPTTTVLARRLTLEDALQQAATPAANPLVQLAELQVEVARQNRLGTRSSFFPQIGSAFENFYFSRFMGERIQVNRPLLGTTTEAGLPLLGQQQVFAALTVTQPITPIFQLRQLYKINLADERIAQAKAGLPISEKAANVERTYYALLIAQRHLALARMDTKSADSIRVRLVSNSAASLDVRSVSDDDATSHALVMAANKVRELTASLNGLLGWPINIELELLPPRSRFALVSEKDATAQALAANPDVIEAEQNVVKARAAVTLQKLAYVPVVAAMGGYAYNGDALPLLPRDFGFAGIIATYNIFDFGKREHTIKAASTQARMAELALELTKAKVAAGVKAAYLDLQQSQQRSEFARRLDSAIEVRKTSIREETVESILAKNLRAEIESLEAEVEYRQALRRLRNLMGTESGVSR
jgi:outer membrane protein TolC